MCTDYKDYSAFTATELTTKKGRPNTKIPPRNNKNARNPNTSENFNRGEGCSGQAHEGCFLRAGLVEQIQLGRNYEAKRFSGIQHGVESSLLTHFRGVPEKKVDSNARDAELRVLIDHKQNESNGVTHKRQCTRTRSRSGK